MKHAIDTAMIQAALVGYQQQLEFINSRIEYLRRKLQGASPMLWAVPQPRKHHVSPEGRARIAAAQRRRWAAAKKRVAGR